MYKQHFQMTRRRFLTAASVLTAGMIASPRHVWAQDSPVTKIIDAASKEPVTFKKIRNNISIIQGSGGNIGVLAGKDGKLMVDAGIDVSKDKIKKVLASINNQPVKHLINTHWHFDHASGNAWIHEAGASITAHQHTKDNLSRTIRVEDWNYTFPPAPAGALPSTVFEKERRLHLYGETLLLKYYGPAHTDSDISVLFERTEVLHVADTWWNGYYPFIDYSTGGNIDGMIAATEANIKMATDKMIIIPGHGEPGNKKDLIGYRDMLVAVREKVSSLKQKGLSLEEITAQKPTAAFDERWGQFVINGKFFTSLVYKGL